MSIATHFSYDPSIFQREKMLEIDWRAADGMHIFWKERRDTMNGIKEKFFYIRLNADCTQEFENCAAKDRLQ